jgi:hypothetical protein
VLTFYDGGQKQVKNPSQCPFQSNSWTKFHYAVDIWHVVLANCSGTYQIDLRANYAIKLNCMASLDIWEIIISFLVGVVVGVATDIIVRLIDIGENVRYRALFGWRKFTKWARNAPIEAKYFNKTANIENRKLPFEKTMDELQRILVHHDFELKGRLGNSKILGRLYGRTEIKLTLTPSYATIIENEEKIVIISQIQSEYEILNCKYRDFTGNLLDLLQISFDVEKNLRDIIGDWSQESLVFKLKRLYEYTGVFSELKLSYLSGKIAGKYDINMSENQFSVYGKLETSLISIVKDIVAFYY